MWLWWRHLSAKHARVRGCGGGGCGGELRQGVVQSSISYSDFAGGACAATPVQPPAYPLLPCPPGIQRCPALCPVTKLPTVLPTELPTDDCISPCPCPAVRLPQAPRRNTPSTPRAYPPPMFPRKGRTPPFSCPSTSTHLDLSAVPLHPQMPSLPTGPPTLQRLLSATASPFVPSTSHPA